MSTQKTIDYNRIEAAIDYLKNNFKDQPSLDEVAEKVHLSPFHFQKLFTEWAGTSPKKFLQFINVEYAKTILKQNNASTLFDTAFEIGLSGTSRLHDLFITIEGMTPADYKNGGKDLLINYSFAESTFGEIIIASTNIGICYLAFETDKEIAFHNLFSKFPNAVFIKKMDAIQQDALSIFKKDRIGISEIKLHLKGTPFQLKVWEALLKIPKGELTTYGSIAENINKSTAARAVGTAIGSNPVAFLIPCHRVIQASGILGGYRWGTTRKAAIIGWEGAQINLDNY